MVEINKMPVNKTSITLIFEKNHNLTTSEAVSAKLKQDSEKAEALANFDGEVEKCITQNWITLDGNVTKDAIETETALRNAFSENYVIRIDSIGNKGEGINLASHTMTFILQPDAQ